jgi:hypothetical protein
MKKGPIGPLFYIFNSTASSAATTAATAIIAGPLVIARVVAWRVRALARVSKVLALLVVEMATAPVGAVIAGHGPSVSLGRGRQASRSWHHLAQFVNRVINFVPQVAPMKVELIQKNGGSVFECINAGEQFRSHCEALSLCNALGITGGNFE